MEETTAALRVAESAGIPPFFQNRAKKRSENPVPIRTQFSLQNYQTNSENPRNMGKVCTSKCEVILIID